MCHPMGAELFIENYSSYSQARQTFHSPLRQDWVQFVKYVWCISSKTDLTIHSSWRQDYCTFHSPRHRFPFSSAQNVHKDIFQMVIGIQIILSYSEFENSQPISLSPEVHNFNPRFLSNILVNKSKWKMHADYRFTLKDFIEILYLIFDFILG